MTLFELLFFLLYVAVGILVGSYAFREFGWLGGILGALLGSGGTILILQAIARFRLPWQKPPWPACSNRICQAEDYKVLPYGPGRYLLQCQCGLKFVPLGKRLFSLEPDGSLKPYMRNHITRGWEADPDETPEEMR